METTKFKWPPLESDPEIFNRYFHKIGLAENIIFEELWCLDYKEIQPLDSPVIGVIAAIRRPKGRFCEEDKLITGDAIPFYMKQQGTLDNACGLVAALHCFGNKKEICPMVEESILAEYFIKTLDKNPEERCTILEEDDKFKEAHSSSAQEGQTEIPNEQKKVHHHYIAFSSIDGNLVELDGTLKGPVVIKKLEKDENLLDEAIQELKRRLELGVISEDLAILFISFK